MALANPLIFYKHITPYWLRDHARLGFNVSEAEITETYFKIPKDSRKNESLFQIELLGGGVLQDDDDITVKLKVAVQYPGPQPRPRPPQRDPMIFVLWCPREDESIGVQINDYQEYQTANFGPFRGADGEPSRNVLRNPAFLDGRRTQDWFRFSEMFEFTFRPNSTGDVPWSSAYCAVDSGTFDAFGPHFRTLRLSKGLNLGVYRDEKDEQYIIKSFEISIYKNSKDVNGK